MPPQQLPVVMTDEAILVIDPDTGEALQLQDAGDRALAHAAEQITALDLDLMSYKRAVAAELRARHGVGKTRAGGYEFTIAESQSWPVGPLQAALHELFTDELVSQADVDRAMPLKPKPDPRQLKALIGRLTVTDPLAARLLAGACTVSPASVRGVQRTAVDAETTESIQLTGRRK